MFLAGIHALSTLFLSFFKIFSGFFFMNIHVFLAVCTGAHLLEWHGSCSQVESDPGWRGWVSGTAGI